jgi:hypothetical protein
VVGASIVLAAFGASGTARAQATVWVDDCAGTGSGTQVDPYCKIQTAICNLQNTGGTINVLPGTYHEAIRVKANFTIISTDGPAVTILDATGQPCVSTDFCTYQAGTTCSAVYFPSAALNTSRLEGFHVTGGVGIDNSCGTNCTVKIGGGITIFGSSPTITRNEIVGNAISSTSTKLLYGGGIYINGNPGAPTPQPVITKNLIQANSADPPAGQNQNNPSVGEGGGIYVAWRSAPVIDGNSILSNRAGNPATLLQFGGGGGLAIYTSNEVVGVEPIVRGNLVADNNAADFGAGIALGDFDTNPVFPSRGTIENNVFYINGGVDGGAIGTLTTRAKIHNNTIDNNNAAAHGGGVYFGPSANVGDQAEFTNNLVTGNQATGTAMGGALYVDPAAIPSVRFNDLYANTPTNVDGAKHDVDYIGVNGGVSVDPAYTNPTGSPPDYHLLPASPVIEAGDNSGVVGTTDYDGAPRIQDADYNGTATVDMGAFEFSPDFDTDGLPDWQDPDDDNDGTADVSDCAPLVKAVSRIPDPVSTKLRVDKPGGVVTISWLHAFQAPTYNVYRGTLGGGVPFAYNETCFDTKTSPGRSRTARPRRPAAGSTTSFLAETCAASPRRSRTAKARITRRRPPARPPIATATGTRFATSATTAPRSPIPRRRTSTGIRRGTPATTARPSRTSTRPTSTAMGTPMPVTTVPRPRMPRRPTRMGTEPATLATTASRSPIRPRPTPISTGSAMRAIRTTTTTVSPMASTIVRW